MEKELYLKRKPKSTGSTNGPGFPRPEQLKALAMPSSEDFRSKRNQSLFPIQESCRQDRGEPGGINSSPKSGLTFLGEGQLFTLEEMLSGQGGAGLEETTQKAGEVRSEVGKCPHGLAKPIA
jgi:hypothetical protein